MKSIYILVGLCLLCAVYFAGYSDGHSTTKGSVYERKIDSLNICLKAQGDAYIAASKGWAEENAQHMDKFSIINTIKNTIKNEIKNQRSEIYSVPDSLFQRYIDSIRANGGFR